MTKPTHPSRFSSKMKTYLHVASPSVQSHHLCLAPGHAVSRRAGAGLSNTRSGSPVVFAGSVPTWVTVAAGVPAAALGASLGAL